MDISRDDLNIYNDIKDSDLNYILDFVKFINSREEKIYYNNKSFKFVGKGSFGYVYKYKSYAIKIFKEKGKDEMFLEELMGIKIYPKIYIGHKNFVIMEYIEGKLLGNCNLKDYINLRLC